MITRQAARSPLLRVPALAVTSLILLSLASCSPHLATAPRASSVRGPQASLATSIGSVDNQLVITVPAGVDPASVADGYGATLIAFDQGIAVLQPPPPETVDDLGLKLRGDNRVISVEHNQVLSSVESQQKSWSFDDGYGTLQSTSDQQATSGLSLSAAHAVVPGNAARVAILDTGIDPNHPLVRSRIVDGWDFVDNDATPTDVKTGLDLDGDGAYGHGTHVAGIVMLTAPGAKLLIGRVLDSEGRGDLRTVAAGIRWAVSKGAKVINLSLGSYRTSNVVAMALHDAAARGVVCVVSAGNSGTDSPVQFPASSSDVISVAADDNTLTPAGFSSYGTFVDITAPGVAVRSAFPGGGYRLWSGTSMSAAWVSGTVAIAKSFHPEWGLAEMLGLLHTTARPLHLTTAQHGLYGFGGIGILGAMYELTGGYDPADPVGSDVLR